MTALAKPHHWPVPTLPVVKPFWKPLQEWLEAGTLVLLAVVALIALAIPLALVVVSIANVLSWLVGRV